jgi:hypothetical protein
MSIKSVGAQKSESIKSLCCPNGVCLNIRAKAESTKNGSWRCYCSLPSSHWCGVAFWNHLSPTIWAVVAIQSWYWYLLLCSPYRWTWDLECPDGCSPEANFPMTSDGALLLFGDSTENIRVRQIAVIMNSESETSINVVKLARVCFLQCARQDCY